MTAACLPKPAISAADSLVCKGPPQRRLSDTRASSKSAPTLSHAKSEAWCSSGCCEPLQSRILETTPAPTVRPPSRMANLRPGSIATGLISSNLAVTLSPGITISTPSGSVTVPAAQPKD